MPRYAGSVTPMAEAREANPGRVRHQFSSTTFPRNDDKDVADASPERHAESDHQRPPPHESVCVRSCRTGKSLRSGQP
jgi:hypothetical protein